jgi:predicted ATP-binding protein involved in virulence
MNIQSLLLQNYRRFEDITIHFNPQFNIIVGNNGAGKTAILEGINATLSNYFVGIFGAKSELKRAIQADDVHRKFFYERPEPQFPVKIHCLGSISTQKFEAIKQKERDKNSKNEGNLIHIAAKLAKDTQNGKPVNLPVLVYYSNGRLNNERNSSRVTTTYARLEGGYYNSSNPTSNNKYFKEWYKLKQLTILQTKADSFELNLIKNAVIACIPEAVDMLYNFEKGIDDIELIKADGERMPFRMLSDGYRNMLAMVADIAFRCVSLNPHLKENALTESEGVVLIDELDLYLHPIWQKRVVSDLERTFPKLQFITTSHSSILVSSVEKNQIIILNEQITGEYKAEKIDYKAWRMEDVLASVMSVTSPHDDTVLPILDILDTAFEDNDKILFQNNYNILQNILAPNDPIISIYGIKQARLELK